MAKGGMSDIVKGRSDLYRVDPRDVNVRPNWNGRDFTDPANIEHVEQLSRSIEQVGVKTPIRVSWEGGKMWLNDGESRLRATLLAIGRGAEIVSIPAIKEEQYASEADILFTQIVGNSGKNLTPLEQAKVFKRLIDFGWTPDDIASKAGMAKQRVTDLLNLQAAPAAITDAVKAGKVSATLATATIRKNKGDTKAAAKELAEAAKAAKASGKTKVTAKHVQPSLKNEVRLIFSRATINPMVPTAFMFSAEDFDRLKKLFKLKL